MMSKSIKAILIGVVTAISNLSIATELSYYLPEARQYKSSIAKPEEVLHYQVGDWHVRPEQIYQYYSLLAAQSDRVKIEVTGYTHEKRPLILAYISSPENIRSLEEIRQKHLSKNQHKDIPVITWMGYSVHGNEASGSNASLLLAYHYAAAKDAKTLAQLDKQVIIVDPMLNPDGLARFAHWVNTYQSDTANTDPKDREHHEEWPRGRTNHYWFDLNRDWLLLQHPESQARVEQFHRWRPHILTDFHEMGTNSSYFFQPGVHSRQNPLTSQANYKMTATIGEHHAKALDNIGSLYYTKENFDDFYYGKGSTYPDAHGSVGILFEQASARGHVQDSNFGELSFPFAIRNHLTTSFSTIDAAQANYKALKKMRLDFTKETQKLAKADKSRGVVFSSQDPYRISELQRILKGHQIKFYPLAKKVTIDKKTFDKNTGFIIPLQQPQYRLITSMFESRKSFKDTIFYDVSAWNFALAFDLNFAFVDRSDFSQSLLGKKVQTINTTLPSSDKVIALAFDWSNFASARLLSEMQRYGLRVQSLTKPTRLKGEQTAKKLSLGSIILPLNNQNISRQAIYKWLAPQLQRLKIEPISITSGLALEGVDLGSPSVPVLKAVKPLLIIGDGVSSYDAGEVWHFLDQRLAQPVTRITTQQLTRLSLNQYTHLILPNGNYRLGKPVTNKIKDWLEKGGVLLAHSGGAKWVLEQGWSSSHMKAFEQTHDTRAKYADKSKIDAKHYVGGAIGMAEIDTTHPLGFGLDDNKIAVFKRGQQVFSEPEEPFVSIARFTKQPHVAGYMSDLVNQHIADQTSILVQSVGRGKVILFSDNPLFRGFWLGTSRVFANALYFSDLIRAPQKTTKKAVSHKKKANGA
ncbi:M14 family metallopeptidase [Aliikangiella sp. IMCC44359]|uniref:M14 family metallopeptidase n=1 Tax=Aliikangiella sp. IMCC44359 TaxID=3459125 RepID=UPI00403AF553